MRFFVLALLCLTVLATGCRRQEGPLGEASCRASERQACPDLVDRTFYDEASGWLFYMAPDGTYYQNGSTEILRGTWRVDETGEMFRMFLPIVGQGPFRPISDFSSLPSVAGDPGRLSTNSRGFYVQHWDERSFETLLSEAAAR
ncbi:hypothetical protein V8J82_22495 [Gymnodinialimonas sp. 2305UL16-5]|uniref:hypothetical protein n=1 Tax=Gymnodinialimonas mytili TaxID=3126503 RepID=UPI0030B260D1